MRGELDCIPVYRRVRRDGFLLALSTVVRDRRANPQRVALVRRIIDEVFSHRAFTVEAVDCAQIFGVPAAVCDRILHELGRAGIIQEARPGIWTLRAHA